MATEAVEVNVVQTALNESTSSAMGEPLASNDPRRARILAKTIYRELRTSGIAERELLAIATEMLGLVADDLRDSP